MDQDQSPCLRGSASRLEFDGYWNEGDEIVTLILQVDIVYCGYFF